VTDAAGGVARAPARPVAAKPALVAAVYALALAWLLAKTALLGYRLPTNVPPDETAHVSFVAYAGESGRFVPEYGEMRLLGGDGRFGPLPNYLAHPSAYYHALAAADRLLRGSQRPGLDAYTQRLRVVSAPFFVAAAALFLWLGARSTRPLAAHAVYAAAVATVPPFAFLGAAVNNDDLAFVAGGVALLGLVRRLEGRADLLTAHLAGAGLALALLSKATAGLLVGLAVLGAFVLERRRPAAGTGRFVLALLPWLVLPALHYVPVFLRYGTPIPSLDVVDPGAFASSAFVVAPDGGTLFLPEWGARMLKLLASTWLSLIGHVAVPVEPVFGLAGPALLLVLATYGLLARARPAPAPDAAGLRLARAGALAVALTLVLNLAWAWNAYTETGRLGGIHARYYLPLLPCLGLAAAVGLGRLRSPAWPAALLAALLLLADAVVLVRGLSLFGR
jgi:hypothetical protein